MAIIPLPAPCVASAARARVRPTCPAQGHALVRRAAAAQDALRTLLLPPSPQACEPQPRPSKPAFVAQCFHEAPPPFHAWPRAPHAHGPARQRRFLACHPAIHRCQDFPSHRNQDLEMGLHGSGSGGQCELPRRQGENEPATQATSLRGHWRPATRLLSRGKTGRKRDRGGMDFSGTKAAREHRPAPPAPRLALTSPRPPHGPQAAR